MGYFTDSTGIHGFLDMAGVLTTINVPGASTFALGINAGGQIVGQFNEATGIHGFLATPTPPTLPVLAGYLQLQAADN